MNARRIPLIIGLVLALGTGALLLTYLMSLRPAAVATRTVLVATHDIPPRALITAGFFNPQQRSASDVDPDALSAPKDVVGKYTLVAIPAGAVATASRIGGSSAATLPAKLPVGMRAMSIPIDNVKAVAGLITPGDRVDVIAIPPHAGNESPRGYAILRGALVLAMGTDLQTTTASPAPGAGTPALSTATLALTPNQADLLAGADQNTVLRLTLRNPKEPIRAFPAEALRLANNAPLPANNAPLPANNAPAATVPLPPTNAAAPPPATAPAPGSNDDMPRHGVPVIDGDRVGSGTAQ